MVQITINGKQIEVPEGTTVLRAAEMAGITIPRLCDHKELTPYGGCRLCIVEVQGVRVPMASCTLPVNNGMVINTETEALKKSRKFVLSMLFNAPLLWTLTGPQGVVISQRGMASSDSVEGFPVLDLPAGQSD